MFAIARSLSGAAWRPSTITRSAQVTGALRASPLMNLRFYSDDGEQSHTGNIKWFDSKKGFGFITSEAFERDIFCHYTCVINNNAEDRVYFMDGDNVEFKVRDRGRGMEAFDVKRTD